MSKKNYKPRKTFFIVKSSGILYAICSNIAEAEGMRKYHNMPFDVHTIMAKTHKEVLKIATRDMGLRPSKRLKEIYKIEPA